MSKLKLQVPVGTSDYLPEECRQKRRVQEIISGELRLNGYDEIETPSFEYYDVFMNGSVPYVQENMIKFFDSKGRILALRPDMTGPIARMSATKLMNGADVLRLCYTGNVYGFKSGRPRAEFVQSGIELIGKKSAEADAEVISIAIRALVAAGLEGFKIDIGQVAYFKGLAEKAGLGDYQVERTRQLIDTKNSVELEYELSRTNMDPELKVAFIELTNMFGGVEVLEKAKLLAKDAMCVEAVENIREVYDILCDYGHEEYISVDFGLLNNFNYYSGIIFRGIAEGVGVPILSGGRYDGLLSEFGADAPATGFAIGIEDLLTVLAKQGRLHGGYGKTTVIKCVPDKRKEAYRYAQNLRKGGQRVILDTNGADYPKEKYDIIQYD